MKDLRDASPQLLSAWAIILDAVEANKQATDASGRVVNTLANNVNPFNASLLLKG